MSLTLNSTVHVRSDGKTVEETLANMLRDGETVENVAAMGDEALKAWALTRLDFAGTGAGLSVSRPNGNIVIMPTPSYG